MELDQEVFVERKCYLFHPNLIYHHEGDFVFLFLCPVVNHIHINDIVFHSDPIASRLLYQVLERVSDAWCLGHIIDSFNSANGATDSARPDCKAARVLGLVKFELLLAFVLQAQLADDLEDTLADVKVAQNADHILELCLFTNLQTVFNR